MNFVSIAQRLSSVLRGLACVIGAIAIAACQMSSQRIAQHEDYLAAAGFDVRPANTPERRAMLARLPAHKFVRQTHGDNIHYVYADPSVCDCLYVGTQKAYSQYQQGRQTRERDKQLEHALEAHDNAAEDYDFDSQIYADPAWSWSAWGPWGPEYGYGPGPGW